MPQVLGNPAFNSLPSACDWIDAMRRQSSGAVILFKALAVPSRQEIAVRCNCRIICEAWNLSNQ
jgi:hypothetical protein